MTGTRAGGKKSARKIGRKALAERGRKGGQNVAAEKRTFSIDRNLAAKAGRAGGKARAIKYQDPNFDKADYAARRKAGLPGTERPRTVGTVLSSDEYLRRTNIKEYNKQKGIEVDDEADQEISR